MGKPGGEADAGRISHRRSASVLSLRRLFCGGKNIGVAGSMEFAFDGNISALSEKMRSIKKPSSHFKGARF